MKRAGIALLLLLGSCTSTRLGPYTPLGELSRETTAAEHLNRKAADLIKSDPNKAEVLLREALTKDLYFGPAHNNLGVLFLEQRKLYEAANEFEWARKLLPGHPDPRVNLALTLEIAGRNDEAFQSYEAALEVSSEYTPAIQGIASLSTRMRRKEPRLGSWLEHITLEGDPAWRDWARAQMISHPRFVQ